MNLKELFMKYKTIIIASILLVIMGGGYFYFKSKGKVETNVQPEHSGNILEEVIKIDPEVLKETEVSSSMCSKSEFEENLSLIGEVAPDPDRIAKISARLAGRVKSVNFVEGRYVNKGQILVVIQSPEVSKLRSKYYSTYSRFSAADKNYKRLKSLVDLKLASEQEAINAESELKIQEAELKADYENLRVYGITVPNINETNDKISGDLEIFAPISGLILSREVIQGSQVEAISNLGMIGDISTVWFMIKLFEKDLSKVDVGNTANIKLNSYPDKTFTGNLVYIGNQIDPGSRSVTARIVMSNPKGLAKLGLFGTAQIMAKDQNIVTVSDDAITEINKLKYVFVEIKNGEYKAIEVVTGRRAKDRVEITSGLTGGELVVDKGMFILKSKLLKSTFGEE